MWCLVNLPNGTTFGVQLNNPKAIGQECLEKVCLDLGITCETEYFGLVQATGLPRSVDTKTKQWINLRNPLFKHDSGREPFHLALRVKFWVPGHLILQDSVRNLFYMQARIDLLEGRINPIDWSNSAKLTALLAHADENKFNPDCLQDAVQSILLNKNEFDSRNQRRRPTKRKSSEYENQIIEQPQSSLQIYESYQLKIDNSINSTQPGNFLLMVAREHEKISKLKMSVKSAKYWLLEEVAKLNGFGEEIFCGVTGENSSPCEVGVGPHGLVVYGAGGIEKRCIPFSAVETAKSVRRTFRLTYVNEEHIDTSLEIKLACQRTAAGLYRAITEKHAFYSCETVRSAVTTQFIRDLKGTIASMFNEDTELGKRYVFDIQRTCREVYDNARRVLHGKGYEVNQQQENPMDGDYESILKEKEEQTDRLENIVSGRIKEAMTCGICMDEEIDTVFFPCGHVMSCTDCAKKCDRCPLCRANITTVNKIFLPSELRVRTNAV